MLSPASSALTTRSIVGLLRSKWLGAQPFASDATAAFERLVDGLRFVGIAHLVVVLRDAAANSDGMFGRAQFADAVLRATGLGGAAGGIFALEPLPLFDAVDPDRTQSASIASLVSGLSALCLSDSNETCAAVFNQLDADHDGMLSRAEFGDFVRSALRVAKHLYPDVAVRVKMARTIEEEFRHEDAVVVDIAAEIEREALSDGGSAAFVDFARFSRWFNGVGAAPEDSGARAIPAAAAPVPASFSGVVETPAEYGYDERAAQRSADNAAAVPPPLPPIFAAATSVQLPAVEPRPAVVSRRHTSMGIGAHQSTPAPHRFATSTYGGDSPRFATERPTPASRPQPAAAPARTSAAYTPAPFAAPAHLQTRHSASAQLVAAEPAATASDAIVSSLSSSLVTSREARERLAQELTAARGDAEAERERTRALEAEIAAMRERAEAAKLAIAPSAAAAVERRSQPVSSASLWDAARRGDINEVHTMLYANAPPSAGGHTGYEIAPALTGLSGRAADGGVVRLHLRYFELSFRVGRRRYIVPAARIIPVHHVVGVYDHTLDAEMNEELRAMHTRQRDRDEWRRVALFLRKNLRLCDAVSAPYHTNGNDAHLHAFVHDDVEPGSTSGSLDAETVERHRGRLPASYIRSTALEHASMDGGVESSAILLCAGCQAINSDWPGDRSDVKVNWGAGMKCVESLAFASPLLARPSRTARARSHTRSPPPPRLHRSVRHTAPGAASFTRRALRFSRTSRRAGSE